MTRFIKLDDTTADEEGTPQQKRIYECELCGRAFSVDMKSSVPGCPCAVQVEPCQDAFDEILRLRRIVKVLSDNLSIDQRDIARETLIKEGLGASWPLLSAAKCAE